MYKSFYEGTALLGYPLFALLFFVAFFSLVVVTSFRRSRTERVDTLARLPLNDHEGVDHAR